MYAETFSCVSALFINQAVSNIVGELGEYSVMKVGIPTLAADAPTAVIEPLNQSGDGLSSGLPYRWWAIPPSCPRSRPPMYFCTTPSRKPVVSGPSSTGGRARSDDAIAWETASSACP